MSCEKTGLVYKTLAEDKAHIWGDQRWLVRVEGIESNARVSTRHQSNVEKVFAIRTNENSMGARSCFVEPFMD